jgi:hypothetical protein
LYLTPVVYTYMAALSEGSGKRNRKLEVAAAPVATVR